MKSSTLAALALLLSAGSALAVNPPSSLQLESSASIVPGKFIVELRDGSQIPKRSGVSEHEHLYGSLRERGVRHRVDNEFNSPGVFTGATVTLDNPEDLRHVRDVPGVVDVRAVRRYSIPTRSEHVHEVTEADPQADSRVKLRLASRDTFTRTGVEKLHAEGILGQGIRIGIIDTGIDYNHPSLGGGLGANRKVIGGYDFVGDDYNGFNTPMPDDDPLDTCNGNGTLVAGIIGANHHSQFGMKGVAPQASLSSYRVFGCSGTVTEDIVIKALLRGLQDNQNILTLSFGYTTGWNEGSASVVVSRIASQGVVVTTLAGDNGAEGPWYTSGSPLKATDGIYVANAVNQVHQQDVLTVDGLSHSSIFYSQPSLLRDRPGSNPLYATSKDTTVPDDACNPLPATTPHLSVYVVLIRAGGCTIKQKLDNAHAKGATVALIYHEGDSFGTFDVVTGSHEQHPAVKAAGLKGADGEFLVKQFVARGHLTISFSKTPVFTSVISGDSSYGPTTDMFLKPALAAPGTKILSTMLDGKFGLATGTSFATSFVAGSVALILCAKENDPSVASSARTLLQTTANPVRSPLGHGGPFETVSHQGAGLIDVFAAARTITFVSPGEFMLNDTTYLNKTQYFTIKNNSWKPKVYRISHVAAGTAGVRSGLIRNAATVQFSKNSVVVFPWRTAKISASFTPPTGFDPHVLPVYSGFIKITSGSEKLQVTYMGVASSLKSKKLLIDTYNPNRRMLPELLDSDTDRPQRGISIYKWANDAWAKNSFPILRFQLDFGTPLLRIDLVPSNIRFTPTYGRRTPPPPPRTAPVFTFGTLYEGTYLTRHIPAKKTSFYDFAFDVPKFTDGQPVPSGNYKMLLRALRVTGDRTKEEDYESWLSPAFVIERS